MRILFLALAVTMILSAAEAPFACNLKALSSAERAQHRDLSLRLFAAVIETREENDGYAFRIAADKATLADLAAWVVLEQQCCPFFGFQIELVRDRGPVWLHLTGRAGVKEFIRDEFKVARPAGE